MKINVTMQTLTDCSQTLCSMLTCEMTAIIFITVAKHVFSYYNTHAYITMTT